jgi:hypothetical protein
MKKYWWGICPPCPIQVTPLVPTHVWKLTIYYKVHKSFDRLPIRIVTTSYTIIIFFSMFKAGNENLNITIPRTDYDT